MEATSAYKRNIPSPVKWEIKETKYIIQEQGQGMNDFHIHDDTLAWLIDGECIQARDTKFDMQVELY